MQNIFCYFFLEPIFEHCPVLKGSFSVSSPLNRLKLGSKLLNPHAVGRRFEDFSKTYLYYKLYFNVKSNIKAFDQDSKKLFLINEFSKSFTDPFRQRKSRTYKLKNLDSIFLHGIFSRGFWTLLTIFRKLRFHHCSKIDIEAAVVWPQQEKSGYHWPLSNCYNKWKIVWFPVTLCHKTREN